MGGYYSLRRAILVGEASVSRGAHRYTDVSARTYRYVAPAVRHQREDTAKVWRRDRRVLPGLSGHREAASISILGFPRSSAG